MSDIDEGIISRARRRGVLIRQIGGDTWSWDYQGLPGGCGLPTEEDAALDALETMGVEMDRRNTIVGRLKAKVVP